MANKLGKYGEQPALITFKLEELNALTDGKACLEHVRAVLAPYFELAKYKINVFLSQAYGRYECCPSSVKTIDISNWEHEVGQEELCSESPNFYFSFDVEIDGVPYYSILYEKYNKSPYEKWFLSVMETDMGDMDTPPTTDLVDLSDSEDFLKIVDALVATYKIQVDQQIGDMLEAEDYEINREMEEEMWEDEQNRLSEGAY